MLERLLPQSAGLSAQEALEATDFGEQAPEERPYVVLNMVATADGRATIDGRAGPIGNDADRELFHQLRTTVDAVMAGAGTARVERYGRLVRDPDLRELRERRGLHADPLACLVSGRLDLPADLPLLQDEHSTVIVVTGSTATIDGCRARVEYLRGESRTLELTSVLRHLRAERGVRSLLCEGGPALNATLLREGLVDELFLSVAAKLAGGPEALTIVSGPPLPGVVDLELLWCLQSADDLFLRYRINHGDVDRT